MVLILESCSLEESCAALGGTPKLLFELRDRLRDWLKLQPHLPQDLPDHMLEHFILGTKMSLEQAKHKLDMSYTIKRYAPELCINRDPLNPSFAELRKMMQIVFLPRLTPEKYTVSVIRPIADDYRKFNAADSLRYMYTLGHIFVSETHNLGTIAVIDNTKATLGWMTAYSPALIKKSEVVATECYATRVKGLHFINASKITYKIITMVKTVLKPKLAQRIHVHQPDNYESLHKFIPKSILPKDYGGDEISMSELSEKWQQKAESLRDWILKEDNHMVDQRLRPGPDVDGDNLFGTSGSFRKLDVD